MENETITIVVNGFEETVPAGVTLSGLVTRFKEGDGDLIVEHNGRFVYPKDYGATTVVAGDRVEFINPNFGG
ncbi:MAG: MoaD/ThiS family protein [Desulfobacterales bacterium]|nr:MoaD/ThiS family protein [Desulfobacterales bacterium]